MHAYSLVVVGLLAGVLTWLAPATTAAAEVQSGHVVGFAGENLIVRSPAFEFETYSLAPQCRIVRDGKPIPWSDLRTGDAVILTAERREGNWLALVIEAHSPF